MRNHRIICENLAFYGENALNANCLLLVASYQLAGSVSLSSVVSAHSTSRC